MQKIEVHLGIHEGRLDVMLRDWGRKVDPASIQPRDLADIRPGGLGVHFIREIMDDAVYDPTPATGTELRMTKKVTPREGAE
jgi:anti-sigma regulatory factor (Ser/Thr protein kinase)